MDAFDEAAREIPCDIEGEVAIADFLRARFVPKGEQETAIEKTVDAEQVRWQDAIDEIVLKYDPNRDGSGCESGDPLDLTCTEVQVAFNRMEDQIDDLRAKLARYERAEGEGECGDHCGVLCPYCEISRLRANLAAAEQVRWQDASGAADLMEDE